jgi:hypothetical protein
VALTLSSTVRRTCGVASIVAVALAGCASPETLPSPHSPHWVQIRSQCPSNDAAEYWFQQPSRDGDVPLNATWSLSTVLARGGFISISCGPQTGDIYRVTLAPTFRPGAIVELSSDRGAWRVRSVVTAHPDPTRPPLERRETTVALSALDGALLSQAARNLVDRRARPWPSRLRVEDGELWWFEVRLGPEYWVGVREGLLMEGDEIARLGDGPIAAFRQVAIEFLSAGRIDYDLVMTQTAPVR